MGNFISGQTQDYTDLGVIFQVTIRKKFPEKTTEITGIKALPTLVHRYTLNNQLKYRVLPLEQTVTQKKDSFLVTSQYPVLEAQLQKMNKHLDSLNVQQKSK